MCDRSEKNDDKKNISDYKFKKFYKSYARDLNQAEFRCLK